jgi:hypothetical protein
MQDDVRINSTGFTRQPGMGVAGQYCSLSKSY